MKAAWFDPVAGVSGDMFVAALLDAGASFPAVKEAVEALALPGIGVSALEVSSHGLKATRFSVVDLATGKNADQVEGHFHRTPLDLLRLIEASPLEGAVKVYSSRVVRLLGEAEAKVHGVAFEEVHFHEVGAADTLVDAVAASAALVYLGVEKCFSGTVRVGSGTVKAAHGLLPVPAPATLELLKGCPVETGVEGFELATPTGAALLRCFAEWFGPMPPMTVEAAGYGAGTKDIGAPNVFRAVLGYL